MNNTMDWIDQHGSRTGAVIASLLILVVAAWAIRAVNRPTGHLMQRAQTRFQLPPETVLLARRFLTGALWVCAGLIILELWGLSVGGLWTAVVSVMTLIGVGFLATWTMVSNVTANLLLTMWRPFHLGQTVSLLPEDLKGRVVDRSLMFTTLVEDCGTKIVIPNNMFFQKPFRVGENSLPQDSASTMTRGSVPREPTAGGLDGGDPPHPEPRPFQAKTGSCSSARG